MPKIIASTILSILLAAPAIAQQPRVYTFLGIQHGDTIGSEVVARAPGRVEVDMYVAAQGIRHWFAMTTAPDHSVRSIENLFYRDAASDEWTQRVEADFDPATATAEVQLEVGGREQTIERPAPAGSIPWIFPSNAVIEQVLLRSTALPGALDTVPLFVLQNGTTTEAIVRWRDAGTADMSMGDNQMRARVAPDGSLLELEIGLNLRIVRVEGSHPLPMASMSPGKARLGVAAGTSCTKPGALEELAGLAPIAGPFQWVMASRQR